jgi:hypothetical protein
MAKIKIDSLIDVELSKLEAKVAEFQTYLEENSITTVVKGNGEFFLGLEEQDKLHKEIVIQIKMQDALFNWMPLLEKLREAEVTKKQQIRGDIEVGGLFNKNKA